MNPYSQCMAQTVQCTSLLLVALCEADANFIHNGRKVQTDLVSFHQFPRLNSGSANHIFVFLQSFPDGYLL